MVYLTVNPSFSQDTVSSEAIVYNYLEAIGGANAWKELKSRVVKEEYIYYNNRGVLETENKRKVYSKWYLFPNNYLEVSVEGTNWFVMSFTSDCAWIYFDQGKMLSFLDDKFQEPMKTFPRIEVLEILNYQILGKEDDANYFKIDFADKFWDRTITVYFNKHTYLVDKYEYSNDGSDFHEFYLSDYHDKEGYKEPYVIESYVNHKKFKKSIKHNVLYNSKIDEEIFDAPIECSYNKKPVMLSEPLDFTTYNF